MADESGAGGNVIEVVMPTYIMAPTEDEKCVPLCRHAAARSSVVPPPC